MTNYIISQNNIDEIVFKYLDLHLKGLEKRKANSYEGVILVYPEKELGVMGYGKNSGTLYIYYKLVDVISSVFGLNLSDSKSVIGRWVSDRYQLKVTNTRYNEEVPGNELVIDTNQ